MTDEIHIALASNKRYLPGLRATMVSLVKSTSNQGRLLFHVVCDGLSETDKTSVREIMLKFGYDRDIDFIEPDMERVSSSFKAYNGSCTTYLRLFFPELFPNLDWVLWTDVDILWFRDVERLWAERKDDFSVVWSPDIPSTKKAAMKQFRKWNLMIDISRYCCAGVMLMNLRKMRQDDFVQKSAEFVAKYGGAPLFADQDVLNVVCSHTAKIVDARWNLLYPIRSIEDGVVIHFNGIGPKFNDHCFSGFSPLYEIWFRYRAEVVEGEKDEVIAKWHARLWFNFLAIFYPFRRAIAFITDPIHPWISDFIQRNLLFAWLRRKVLWK